MKTIIHVNQNHIRKNINLPESEQLAVITVKTYKSNAYTNSVDILDNDGSIIAKLVYSPNKPLSCGARLWIEVEDKNVRIN